MFNPASVASGVAEEIIPAYERAGSSRCGGGVGVHAATVAERMIDVTSRERM
jgi:hypothetical protein